MRPRRSAAAILALLASILLGCSGDDPTPAQGDDDSATSRYGADSDGGATTDELHPDVLDVELTELGGGSYEVATTLSSPYDSPERYADAWRVLDGDGNELGVRELTHDHAGEQPFTRSLTLEIPDDVDEITVEGRDQVSGYGGQTVTVAVPSRSS